MMVSLRDATAADREVLERIRTAATGTRVEGATGPSWFSLERLLANERSDEGPDVLIAELHGGVVAWGALYLDRRQLGLVFLDPRTTTPTVQSEVIDALRHRATDAGVDRLPVLVY